MNLTEEQLENIAAWKPADERFASADPISDFISPAMAALCKSGRWQCHIVDDGGMSNYYSIGVHASFSEKQLASWRHHRPHNTDGLLIYLSLMLPVGVLGHTSFSIASDMFGCNHLEMGSLIDPSHGADDLVDAILEAFNNSIYCFLDRDALALHLPREIAPFGCLCAEPWDRVFHVLFQNAD